MTDEQGTEWSDVTIHPTVRLFEGQVLLGSGTATGGTWSITSTELGLGVHSITAEAEDAAGNVSPRSTALTITIVASDLELAWPLEGKTLFATETLEIGFAPVGATSVDYLVDGAIVGSVTNDPWTFAWDTTAETDSSHTVQALAHTPGGAPCRARS